MNQAFRYTMAIMVFVAALSAAVMAAERTETFTFEDIRSVDIKTISGEVTVLPGDGSKLVVELLNDLDDPEQLDPEVEADNGRLLIEEHFTGRNIRGETFWTLYLPKGSSLRSVECKSASGDISLQEFEADFIETESASGRTELNSIGAKEIDLSTASGAINIEDCQADVIDAESASGRISVTSCRSEELDVSTASGRISLADCEADFIRTNSASGRISVESVEAKELDLSNASGKIAVQDAEIDESGKISSASGDVRLYLPRLPSESLEASSASSDVLLKVPQFGENFSMTLMKRADKGRVRCPFEYTDKETIRLSRHDRYLTDRYLVKRGKGGPEIELSTASGTIEIETETKGK
jgi:DUF4097 and DUF4098 domain-containing protein YvlB